MSIVTRNEAATRALGSNLALMNGVILLSHLELLSASRFQSTRPEGAVWTWLKEGLTIMGSTIRREWRYQRIESATTNPHRELRLEAILKYLQSRGFSTGCR